MAAKRKRRLLLFVPDGAQGEEFRAAALAAHKGLEPVEMGPVPTDPAQRSARSTELADVLRGVGGRGFVIVDPPAVPADLAWLDDVFRTAFGKRKRNLPVAVFFSPRPVRKKQVDPYEDYRASFRERFHYYRQHRRSVTFDKPKSKAARKAVKLASKSRSPVRWGVLTPMAGVVLFFFLVLIVFRDGLLHAGAERAGQSAFGARVDIEDLLTTFRPSLRLDGVAVADSDDPMRNLVEFGALEADFDLLSLLTGSLLVDRAVLTGLAFGTERTESGALDEKPAPTEPEEPGFSDEMRGRLDELFEDLAKKLEPPAIEDLETVRVARDIQTQAQERLAFLQSSVEDNPIPARIKELRADVERLIDDPLPASLKELRGSIEGLSGLADTAALDDATERLANLKAVAFSEEKKLLADAESRVEAAQKELDNAQKAITNARKIKKLDLRNAASLPGTIKGLRDSISGIDRGRKRLEQAQNLVTRATKGLTSKKEDGDGRLAALRQTLTDARSSVDQTTGAGTDALAGVTAQLATARADVAAREAQVRAALDQAEAEVQNGRDSAASLATRVAEDVSFFASVPTQLEEAARRDVDNLSTRYSLEAFDSEEIVRTLVGEKVFGWLELGQRAYDRVRPHLGGEDGEGGPVVHDTAGPGVTYEFPIPVEEVERPGFWVREAEFDGILQLIGGPLEMRGSASDLSSAPAVVGRDAIAKFEAREGGREVGGQLQYTGANEMQIDLTGAGFSVGGTSFRGRHAPKELAGGTMRMGMRVAYGKTGFRANVDVGLADLELVPRANSGIDPRIASVLADVYTSFDELDATFEIATGSSGIETFDVSTDIGDELQQTFETALDGFVQEAKAEAQSELEARIAKPRDNALRAATRFDRQSGGFAEQLLGEVTSGGDLVSASRERLETELMARLQLPEIGAGGSSAELTKALNALTRQADREENRLASQHSAQAEAGAALLESLGVTGGELSGIDGMLSKELDRLLGLK